MSGRCGGGRRRNLARAKLRVEDCTIALDVRHLLPDGCAVEGHGIARAGGSSLAYQVLSGDENAIDVAYRAHDGKETRSRYQRIALVPSWGRFEALGLWFSCPRCGRRVTKVYLPDARGMFACRRCSRLIYRSTQTHDARVDRLRRDPRRVAGILGGDVVASETELVLAMKACASGPLAFEISR